jgi:hypothetical protein
MNYPCFDTLRLLNGLTNPDVCILERRSLGTLCAKYERCQMSGRVSLLLTPLQIVQICSSGINRKVPAPGKFLWITTRVTHNSCTVYPQARYSAGNYLPI